MTTCLLIKNLRNVPNDQLSYFSFNFPVIVEELLFLVSMVLTSNKEHRMMIDKTIKLFVYSVFREH